MTAAARPHWPNPVMTWGTSLAERQQGFTCDRMLAMPPDRSLFRGITVDAPAAVTFRWLCQLRAAPYSYDLIDNWGHRSPGRLTPGLENLAVGQPVMTIFELVDFSDGRHLTLRLENHPFFGSIAGTYLVVPVDENQCRLVVKLMIVYPRSPIGWLMRGVLPAGDLVMMRKQLMTLKQLAERGAPI